MRCAVLLLSLVMAAWAGSDDNHPPVPRPAPDLTVFKPEGGQLFRLDQYKGKVIVLSFVLTTCPHCQHESQILTKLESEYGRRGVQMLGCAFDPMARMVVPDFVKNQGVTYPVGWQSQEAVYRFLSADPNYAIHVPQLVFIDRKGVVRHQSLYRTDGETGKEENVRKYIEELLAEPAGTRTAKRAR